VSALKRVMECVTKRVRHKASPNAEVKVNVSPVSLFVVFQFKKEKKTVNWDNG
jgi:hypothetical protein